VTGGSSARGGRGSSYLLVPMMPTPNGSLHLGHVAGPYLKMDVLRRALLQEGRHAALITTSDGFETHVLHSAGRLGLSAAEVCARFHEAIRRDFEYMQISFDAFVDPVRQPWAGSFRAVHAAVADTLIARGRAHCVDEPYLVDEDTGEPVLGFRLSGTCPQCSSETVGFVCESCGLQVTTEMLGAPGSTSSGGGLSWRTGRTIALHDAPAARLKRQIAATHLPAEFKRAMTEFLADQRNVIRLTTLGDHGVGPYAAWGETFTLYNTYFGHAIACGELYAELFGGANPFEAGSDVVTVTSCGLDNATDLVSSMAFAEAHGAYRGFDYNLGNFYLLLEGSKFSTGSGHAIFVADLAARGSVDVDAMRFYLASISPENGVRDFAIDEFVSFHDAWFARELHGGIDQAVRTASRGRVAPVSDASARAVEQALGQRREALALESFSLARYAGAVRSYASRRDFAGPADAYFWLAGLALLAWPLMPASCGRIWRSLGHDGDPREEELFTVAPAAAVLRDEPWRTPLLSRADLP
jgi:methionyl-tRNA synthetase